MPDIFISYKREERDKARMIAKALAGRGYDTWWDVELLPGDKFADEIEAVIRKVKVAIVLWSRESVKSDFVRAEASLALKRGILIPSRLDDTSIPLPFGEQHILDLQDWDGSSEDPILNPLIDAIEKRIGKGQPTAQFPAQIDSILGQPNEEAFFWRDISKRIPQEIDEYKLYLEKYGDYSTFSDLARLRIEKLKSEQKKPWPKIAQVVAGATTIIVLLAASVEVVDRFGLLDRNEGSDTALVLKTAPIAPVEKFVNTTDADSVSTIEPDRVHQIYGSENENSRILIKARKNAWIQVRDNVANRILLTRLLSAGDSYRVPDQTGLILLTGNAHSLEILVDGKAVPDLGETGMVQKNVTLDPVLFRQGTAAN